MTIGEHDVDRLSRGQTSVRGQVGPVERTTRLRRFVVTERVVQSVEEVPDRESST